MYNVHQCRSLLSYSFYNEYIHAAEFLSMYCGYKTFERSLVHWVVVETNLCCIHQRDEGKLLVLRHCDVLVVQYVIMVNCFDAFLYFSIGDCI